VRILIVDDSGTMRAMIKRVVLLSGLSPSDVLEAGDGAAALAILEKDAVDLLVTDIHMPVMSGLELLQKIAGQSRWSRLERVVFSTDGSMPCRDEVERCGVRCYLEKPFSPEMMRDFLEEFMAPARERGELINRWDQSLS
jgi:two-component system chemotaxis response regulator CheY